MKKSVKIILGVENAYLINAKVDNAYLLNAKINYIK